MLKVASTMTTRKLSQLQLRRCEDKSNMHIKIHQFAIIIRILKILEVSRFPLLLRRRLGPAFRYKRHETRNNIEFAFSTV